MARYCIVAPPQILTGLQDAGAIGRNHLLLAHDIVRKDRQHIYNMLFDPSSQLHPYHTQVILDNGVVETAIPVDLPTMVAAAETVMPTCIVLPDKYYDTDGTIESCTQALEPWSREFEGIPLMYLPQGKTENDFFRCATHEPLMSDPRIGWWGVPRNLTAHHHTRERATRLLHALNPRRKIHLFGFSDNLYDDIICSQLPMVESIDSAVPVRQTTKFPGPDFVKPRGDWWEKGRLNDLSLYNIHMARTIFGA